MTQPTCYIPILNTQPMEARSHQSSTIDVHSVFYTIQGEGPFTGVPAVFIRLAGCNLQCPMCDTEYSAKRAQWQLDTLVKRAMLEFGIPLLSHPAGPLVVITGGEPFRQPCALGILVEKLLDKGCRVQIETNGTLPPPAGWVHYNFTAQPYNRITVVVSPKTRKVHPATAHVAKAWKYVARAGEICEQDGLPDYALGLDSGARLFRPTYGARVYLQPADEKDDAANLLNQQACAVACMKHGHTLQLQMHKIIGME